MTTRLVDDDGYEIAPDNCQCGAELDEQELCCSFFVCGGRWCRKRRGGTDQHGWDLDECANTVQEKSL